MTVLVLLFRNIIVLMCMSDKNSLPLVFFELKKFSYQILVLWEFFENPKSRTYSYCYHSETSMSDKYSYCYDILYTQKQVCPTSSLPSLLRIRSFFSPNFDLLWEFFENPKSSLVLDANFHPKQLSQHSISLLHHPHYVNQP